MNIQAHWIWPNRDRIKEYNQAALFTREFELGSWKTARIAIAADSWYRLSINGKWLNDGPARNYPNHFQYEEIDLAGVLVEGRNEIKILARYFGSGTAHQLPQQAGMLAQLEVILADDSVFTVASDSSWMAADFPALISNTSRFSIKQEAAELYDARLMAADFHPAEELFHSDKAPWSGLHPRDCRLLTRNEVNLQRFVSAGRVTSDIWNLSIPAEKILHPGSTTTNFSTSLSCGAAFEVQSPDCQEYEFICENIDVYVNGIHLNPIPTLLHRCRGTLLPGENILVVLSKYPFENQADLCVTIVNPGPLTISNPLDNKSDKVCFLRFPEFHWKSCEIPRHMWANSELQQRQREATDYLALLGREIAFCRDLPGKAEQHIVQLDKENFSRDDAHWAFCAREIAPAEVGDIEYPENLLYDTPEWTRIYETSGHDIELLYDLGEQNIGYWDFEIHAPEGTVVDLFAVEYISEDGLVQHTDDVRNGFRYICHEGLNRHTSVRRRSGRFLFVTFRSMTGPVAVKFIRLIASTYPVNQQGTFFCSNEKLNRIWNVSARTVKLCMEDVYTDCPLYEQSLWLGDARNIALFSFPLFAPWDLARRCIRIGGYSLDRYPIAGSQVPSGWDCLIPSWSFLWGVSVWDYYMETADVDFIKEVFPMVLKNIDGAWAHLDPDCGLFTMYTWNLFEWVETDTHQPRMLYDSMTLSAAISSAVNCAEAIEDWSAACDLRLKLKQLNDAINRSWLPHLQGFPDSFRKESDDLNFDLPANLAPGTVPAKYAGPCRDVSVHTSMLSILFDIIGKENYSAAADNVLNPRPELFKVRNMFAKLYLYQCLEKLGHGFEVMDRLLKDYQPMLRIDSSTTWENFESANADFPCRSHCHAWSSGALYFSYRLILGLRMLHAGAEEFILSPEIGQLEFAEGSRATVKGLVNVRWKRTGKELTIKTSTPPGVKLTFESNRSLEGLKVIWNGEVMQERQPAPSPIRMPKHADAAR